MRSKGGDFELDLEILKKQLVNKDKHIESLKAFIEQLQN